MVQAGPSFPVLPPFPGKLSGPLPRVGGHPRAALISSDGQRRQGILQSARMLPQPLQQQRFSLRALGIPWSFQGTFQVLLLFQVPLCGFVLRTLSLLLANLTGTHDGDFSPEPHR